MSDKSFLHWPFFEEQHRRLAAEVEHWIGERAASIDHGDIDAACRALVTQLGEAGFLEHCVSIGTAGRGLDVRSLALIRETLARHDGLADFAFAMQGLGSGAITVAGTREQQEAWLPRVAEGSAIAAFALTEPDAGSDVAAMALSARTDGDSYVLNGEKTFISNGGIADFYVVFARTSDDGARGISAFIVEADNPGLSIAERIHVIAPHPLGRLRFDNCRVSASMRLGEEGQGFKIAMATLDIFRTTVGAAALGFARRALDEALARSNSRELFGAPMRELPLVQTAVAEMAVDIDASALLIYRAAWTRDNGAERVTREAAMAKLYATDSAQQTIDKAVQLYGGLGVTSGIPVESLYREIRALRIYEGASEVQKLVIARQVMAN